ncbi:MAG TPA: pyridoxal-phosphate dependent enzyme [Puia sp.]
MVNLQDIPIDPLDLPQFRESSLDVRVLRLDKIHPDISGNKWFKLKYYLEEAGLRKMNRLISFGGPYSNHILALACAAHTHGFSSTGYIRGERPVSLSHTLLAARKYGMDLEFLPRTDYRNKEDPAFLSALQTKFPDALIIPEGACGEAGIRGAEEILSLSDTSAYSHICCAVGTGATLAGLVNASKSRQQITGISVLKGTRDREPLDLSWIKDRRKISKLKIFHDFHFGGYAAKTGGLLCFMNEVYSKTGIPTDFVYTGKLLYAISELARLNYFQENSRILIVHSGGMQGNLSLPAGQLQF